MAKSVSLCLDCKKELSDNRHKRCQSCHFNHIKFIQCYCEDCGAKLNSSAYKRTTTKCRKCWGISERGKNNPNHKHGKTSLLNRKKCKLCDNLLSISASWKDRELCWSCFVSRRKGENHHLWNGGTSRLPYHPSWSREYKESIRKEYNHTCQICGKTKTELQEDLSVHHIDYDKQNCTKENLTVLCKSCHCKTNYNRSFWINYFNKKQIEITV